MNSGALPLSIVAGYLGSGKTTLVNHVLRNAGGRRIGVLVNDFGSVNIDADLVESASGDIVRLGGGCVCCQFGDDLTSAVMGLTALPDGERPDQLLLETSGVALPGPMVASLRWLPGLSVAGALVLVDAENVRNLADDRFVGDVVQSQISQADLLVVTKADLVDDVGPVIEWLRTRSGVPLLVADHGAVPVDVVMGPFPRRSSMAAAIPADARFVSITLSVDVADPEFVVARLSGVPGLCRAKGFVSGPDGSVHLVQIVGPRVTITAWTSTLPKGSVDVMVCIGIAGVFDSVVAAASLT